MKIRTIRLELLRHGRPNNQLLSPLTRYLGVCGKVGVTSISIPYEHQILLDRLDRLRQWHGPDRDAAADAAKSRAILERTGAEITEKILARNPGLVPQLHDGANHDQALMELQIVLSATELSLIPFEIAKIPDGCIGSPASWLGIQSKAPVCITRGTRSMTHPPVQWDRDPRILFITADVPEQLVVAHLRALLEALDPWLPGELRRNEDLPGEKRPAGEEITKHLEEMLVCRSQASLADIRETCETAGPFTHVHILAHGARNNHLPGNPVGIMLWDRQRTGRKVVSADSLASALAGGLHRQGSRTDDTLPLVVTLANCDIASAGDVVYSHGSFAHLLHEEGVAVVIGAQFPLSFAGSTRLTRSIYTHLLRGNDPRIALHEARQALFSDPQCSTHDWASLVGYIALPPDFDQQLPRHFYRRQKGVIENIMKSIDKYQGNGENGCHTGTREDTGHPYRTRILQALLDRLDRETARLPDDPCFESEVLALKGSIAKRKAQVMYREEPRDTRYCRHLLEARRLYRQAAEAAVGETETGVVKKRSPHWSLTQFLSLQLVLNGELTGEDMEKWHAAYFAARVDMKARHGSDRQIWAYASAMELNLLRAVCEEQDSPSQELACEQACFICENGDSFPVASSRRQIRRYLDWWSEIMPAACHGKMEEAVWATKREKLRTMARKLYKTLDRGQC
ncbi:MAG TPA: CHAT domain-containing protein [Desulfobulbus sp.]|nr:CHAT domain-containing protein [Desulfobulbus sp.]